MEKLPPEIIQYLAGLLDQHPPSLRAFASVNRGCHYAASAYLFHTLHFKVREKKNVIDLAEKYSQQLKQASAFQRVRFVSIEDNLDAETSKRSWLSQRYQRWVGTDVQRNDLWLPLASLVKRLPGLSDLTFGGSHKFPICLLDSLHQHHPRCRLHMRQFRPHNFDGSPIAGGRLNSSPCLHSIEFTCRHEIGIDRQVHAADNDKDLAMGVVAKLAPNLKEVIDTHWHIPGRPVCTHTLAGIDRERDSRASLESLTLSRDPPLSTQEIEEWMLCTDFSVLQSLKLQQDCSRETTLRYLMQNAQLPCLKSLSLCLTWRYCSAPFADTSQTARDFLQWLPPLRSLAFIGWSLPDIPIDSFLVHHGACLTNLSLAPCRGMQLSLSDLTQIAENCPLLETLAISIRRTYGDAREVASYRALGSLPKLQHLKLDLDVSEVQRVPGKPTPEDSDDDDDDEFKEGWMIPFDPRALPNHALLCEFDLEPYMSDDDSDDPQGPINGRIRGLLINAAIDKTLACSIFESISARKPRSSIPLERLDVKAIRINEFGEDISMTLVMIDVFHYIAKEWQVERNPRDDTDELVARETGEPVPNMVPKMDRFPELTRVWRSIWPKSESGDWTSEWHSWPLST